MTIKKVVLDMPKKCYLCGEEETIRYTYKYKKNKKRLVFQEQEYLDPIHACNPDLAEARAELEILEIVCKAKQQQITDMEWEIFKQNEMDEISDMTEKTD